MDEDDRELVRGLMAQATAMLEDAIEVAVAGQSTRLGPAQLAAAARRLEAAARDIVIIVEAAAIIADMGPKGRGNPRKSGP